MGSSYLEWEPVSEIMTPSVVTVTPDDPLTDAARTMIDNKVGSLVVVDEGENVAGIVTRTDVVEFVADSESTRSESSPTVRSRMTTDVVTISRDATFEEAVDKLMSHDIHHLPVMHDGELDGIITTTDLGSVFSSIK